MGLLKNNYGSNGNLKSRKIKYVSRSSGGQPDPQTVQQQNALVLKWAPMVRSSLRGSARWFSDGKTKSFVLRDGGRQTEKKLAASIMSKVGKEFGLANYVGFSFERHGVFVHKGVGRGYQSNGKGFVIRTARRKPNPHERYAVEWFNPVLEKYIPILANELANINADAAVNATRMKIS
ncbi:MAG TPA: hypothetical protein DHV48_01045 [Prolixibacteraceae bacterium]|nr:hypothetical protein [Prolixibacteraceae bacterium]